MICSEGFTQFVETLSTEENSFIASRKAFLFISNTYHIGQVSYHFKVGATSFTPGGDESQGVFFQAEGVGLGTEAFVKEYHTGENGALRVMVTTVLGAAPWTDEEKADLNTVLNVYFFHIGRFRLITQARKNSMTDFMTGLPNADGYMAYAVQIFRRHELNKYNSYYFNLKNFGLVNRKFGQAETDEIIKRYADVLKDFVNGDEIVGRLGGDNFVALIRKERTQEFLSLISGVEIYGIVGEDRVPLVVKAVAGVLEIDESLDNCEPIISKCAVALNVAKNIKKKPYMFATSELESRMYRQKQITARFPEAIANEEFVVYYQPKVETNTYMIVGAEALVRWFSDGKLVSPGEFIPVIEQDGSVCRLDFYMLEHVCRDIRHWLDIGIEPVRVSVNFSRKHLSNPNLSEDIISVINRYNVPTKYIEVEVTETTDEEEQGMLGAFMGKMREYNIATAIDDFGTGYSSLNILRTFPVDVLKIDKSFIDDENITESDGIVLTNIIKMAKELHMDVITEGVEKWNQVQFLHDIECNLVQGFLFDKPMPVEEFEKKIRMKKYDVNYVKDLK